MREETLVKKLEELFSQMLPPPSVLGKVVKIYESGGRAHFLNCVYSADVELLELDESGNFKDSGLVVPDVPIISAGVGNQRGIFFLPEIGSIVKVSFLYGSWDYPVIDGVLPYGKEILAHPSGELVVKADKVKASAGQTEWSSQTTHNGNLTVNGNLIVNGNIVASGEIADLGGSRGSLSDLRETYNTHTHNGSPPPDRRL